jgi:hypothetical protein
LSRIFTVDGDPNFTSSTEEDTKDTPKDSVGSNKSSSIMSISIHFPFSPGWNVTSVVLETKSPSPAVPVVVAKLGKTKLENSCKLRFICYLRYKITGC